MRPRGPCDIEQLATEPGAGKGVPQARGAGLGSTICYRTGHVAAPRFLTKWNDSRAAGELPAGCRPTVGELPVSCRRAAGELPASCLRAVARPRLRRSGDSRAGSSSCRVPLFICGSTLGTLVPILKLSKVPAAPAVGELSVGLSVSCRRAAGGLPASCRRAVARQSGRQLELPCSTIYWRVHVRHIGSYAQALWGVDLVSAYST